MIRWQGLEMQVADDGSLQHIRLEGHGQDAIGELAVRFAPGWRQTGTELLLDEVEQRFACDGAHAVVRLPCRSRQDGSEWQTVAVTVKTYR